MQVDYIIVGQGICGSFLSWNLRKAGCSFKVIDQAQPFSSTKVASGVINPVTGRQVVTTWMAEDLLPFAENAYRQLGADIGATLVQSCSVMAFPPSEQMARAYAGRIAENNPYLHPVTDQLHQTYASLFHFFHGVVAIRPSLLVQLHPLLKGWRQWLVQNDALAEEPFDNDALVLDEAGVAYKQFRAKKILFCDGISSMYHPLWNRLPFGMNKGQALIADIPGLPADNIYKFGAMTLVPWYDGLWWIGSSYENEFTDTLPSAGFREKTVQALQSVLKTACTVVDHLASVRPVVAVERRPFVGLHPLYPQAGILNGMGTKGCSLAPYFAEQFTRHLLAGDPLDPTADVQRFTRILSR
jgi:glycine/D-amino acid oxidase-like deaminating enzyme